MAAADARYYCDQPSCEKSFQRMEHLKRHQLNRLFTDTLQDPPVDFYRYEPYNSVSQMLSDVLQERSITASSDIEA